MTTNHRLARASNNLPPAVPDVHHLSGSTDAARLEPYAAGMQLLPSLPRLTTLAVSQVGEQEIEAVAACKELRNLFIEGYHLDNLNPLAYLPNRSEEHTSELQSQ